MTYTTNNKGFTRFNYTWPLAERIKESRRMIAEMAKDGRGPKMSIPAGEMLERGGDEDIFISDTLRDCWEQIQEQTDKINFLTDQVADLVIASARRRHEADA